MNAYRPLLLCLCLSACACLDAWAASLLDSEPDVAAEEAESEPEASSPPSDAGPAPAQPLAPLRIGAFNVQQLGAAESTDIPLVASLIEEHFDLVGLVEVMHTGNDSHAGYDALLSALGPAWAGQVSAEKRPNIDTEFAEYYAVLRRTERVALCEAFPDLTYHPDADGTRAQAQRDDLFLREPAFGCYRVQRAAHEPTGFDFVLGVYHARWGSGSQADIKSELRHLDAVFAHQRALHPEERDFLLVGDLNLDAAQLAPLVQATPLVVGGGTTLNRYGEISPNQLDHILVLDVEHTQEFLGVAEVLDVRQAAGSSLAYRSRVSDHLPVRALFDAAAADDD